MMCLNIYVCVCVCVYVYVNDNVTSCFFYFNFFVKYIKTNEILTVSNNDIYFNTVFQ